MKRASEAARRRAEAADRARWVKACGLKAEDGTAAGRYAATTGELKMWARKNPGKVRRKNRVRDEDKEELEELTGGAGGNLSATALAEGSGLRGAQRTILQTISQVFAGQEFTAGQLERELKGQIHGSGRAVKALQAFSHRAAPFTFERTPGVWVLTEHGANQALGDRIHASESFAADAVESAIAHFEDEAAAEEARAQHGRVARGKRAALKRVRVIRQIVKKLERKAKRAAARPRTRTVVEPHKAKREPCRLCRVGHSLKAHRSHRIDGAKHQVTLAGVRVENPMSKAKGFWRMWRVVLLNAYGKPAVSYDVPELDKARAVKEARRLAARDGFEGLERTPAKVERKRNPMAKKAKAKKAKGRRSVAKSSSRRKPKTLRAAMDSIMRQMAKRLNAKVTRRNPLTPAEVERLEAKSDALRKIGGRYLKTDKLPHLAISAFSKAEGLALAAAWSGEQPKDRAKALTRAGRAYRGLDAALRAARAEHKKIAKKNPENPRPRAKNPGTLADAAEAWGRKLGLKIPARNSAAWQGLYRAYQRHERNPDAGLRSLERTWKATPSDRHALKRLVDAAWRVGYSVQVDEPMGGIGYLSFAHPDRPNAFLGVDSVGQDFMIDSAAAARSAKVVETPRHLRNPLARRRKNPIVGVLEGVGGLVNPRGKKKRRSYAAGKPVGHRARFGDLPLARQKDKKIRAAALAGARFQRVPLADVVGEVCLAPNGSPDDAPAVGPLESLSYRISKASPRAKTRDGRTIIYDHAAGDHGKGRRKTEPMLVAADPVTKHPFLVSRRGSRAGWSSRRGLIG